MELLDINGEQTLRMWQRAVTPIDGTLPPGWAPREKHLAHLMRYGPRGGAVSLPEALKAYMSRLPPLTRAGKPPHCMMRPHADI